MWKSGNPPSRASEPDVEDPLLGVPARIDVGAGPERGEGSPRDGDGSNRITPLSGTVIDLEETRPSAANDPAAALRSEGGRAHSRSVG